MVQTLRTRRRSASSRFRSPSLEILERRDMLSGAPPKVVNVEVLGTAWSPAFVQYLQTSGLGANGYAIPKGSSAQLTSLTWTNIDKIMITFDKDVNVDKADLALTGVNTTQYEFSGFRYDPQKCLATWTLSASLNKDRLRIELNADGLNPVSDLDGNRLDGEWTNNVSTASGNGTAGGNFAFNFNVLPTDVDNSAAVSSYDYIYIRQLDGKSTTSTGYIAKRDINGSGLINSTDWQEALNRAGQTLPSGSPAGTSNHAPSTSGFNRVQLSDAALDAAISLLAGFDDAESGSSGLAYSIRSDSNPSLFSSASIDPNTKELVLHGISGAVGRATIVIRAADAGGLFVDTPVTVDVNRDNSPPVLSNFVALNAGAGTWIVSGDVSDSDDDVRNLVVNFYGVFATRAAVDDTGHFAFAVILDEDVWGWEYAVAFDSQGAASNVGFTEIGLT